MKRIKCPSCKGTGFTGNTCCRRCEGTMSIEVPEGKTMVVTLRMLERWGACRVARDRFSRLFGEQVEVTEKAVREWRKVSEAEGFGGQDPGWIICCALTQNIRDSYQRLKKEFVARVNETYDGPTLQPYDFGNATNEVGRWFSNRRLAAAINQVLEVAQ